MAYLTGYTQIFAGDTTVVDTGAKHPLRTRGFDANGNEYIYLQGVASTVAGDWVVYDEDGLTARMDSSSRGPVAVAMAATVASRYGWYAIFGDVAVANAISGGAAADNAQVYATTTAGQIDDVDVAGSLVIGAVLRSAESSGAAEVQLNYPYIADVAVD